MACTLHRLDIDNPVRQLRAKERSEKKIAARHFAEQLKPEVVDIIYPTGVVRRVLRAPEGGP